MTDSLLKESFREVQSPAMMLGMASISSTNVSALPKAAQALFARHGGRLPGLANLLLVIVIAHLLAKLVWLFVPVPASAAWQPPPPPPRAAAPQVDLDAIASAELFGAFQAVAQEPVAQDIDNAPDTQLSVTLLGILANDRDAKLSRALIAAQGGEEKPYSIGDDLSHGVIVQSIFADRVILSRGGKLETLRLERDKASNGFNAGAPDPDGGIQQQLEQYGVPSGDFNNYNDTGGAEAVPQSYNPSANPGPALSKIRTQLLSDPSKVSDYIRIQPVNSGEGVNGYRIYPGKDRSVFSAAGLRPGDIVTSINGVQLNDPAKSLQLLGDLSRNNQLRLTVTRGGQPKSFDISLKP